MFRSISTRMVIYPLLLGLSSKRVIARMGLALLVLVRGCCHRNEENAYVAFVVTSLWFFACLCSSWQGCFLFPLSICRWYVLSLCSWVSLHYGIGLFPRLSISTYPFLTGETCLWSVNTDIRSIGYRFSLVVTEPCPCKSSTVFFANSPSQVPFSCRSSPQRNCKVTQFINGMS